MSKILLFNADDWGLSQGIHDAITALHRAGAIDAAGIMMGQRFTGQAVAYAEANPDLKTGIHLFANDPDCRPLTRNRWPVPWPPGLLICTSLNFRHYREIALEEADAQLRAWKETGLPLHFVNSHMGFHGMKDHLEGFVKLVREHFPDFRGWIRLGDPRYFDGTFLNSVEPIVDLIEQGQFAMSWGGRTNDTIWGTDRVFKNRASDIVKAFAELGDGFHEFYFHPGRSKSLGRSGSDHDALMELATLLPAAKRNVALLPHS